jgi:sulfur carrier protein
MAIEMMLNGEPRALPAPMTLADALVQWGYVCEKVAVAINGEFVARADYAQRLLQERDCLDVVAPVQGG